MTKRVFLHLPRDVHDKLKGHLLSPNPEAEEVAFIYADIETSGETVTFRCREWQAIPPEGFAVRSPFHLELTDETRAAVIKRAHDLGASVVEAHSHLSAGPPDFSPSDECGFEEFVPHIWWRLKGRPYGAVVFAASGFRGRAWLDDPSVFIDLHGIRTEKQLLKAAPKRVRIGLI